MRRAWPLTRGLGLQALAAGALQALSLALPWSGQPWGGLQWLSLLWLVVLLQRERGWGAGAALGGLFAGAWLSGTFWWLYISMHTYGGLPAPLAVAGVLGLAAFLGSYYAAAAAIFVRFRPQASAHWFWNALFFGALWTLAEWARGSWFTGFPWGAGGYAHANGAAAWLAPWVGVYGVGAAMAVAAAVVARCWWHLGRVLTVLGGLLALGCVPAPEWPASAAPLEVSLLQGNIPQDEKFQAGSGVPVALQWYAEQLDASTAALVVAPETALPLLPQQLPAGYWDGLRARFTGEGDAAGAQRRPQAALIGLPLGDARAGYTNSVLGLAPGQAADYHYHKHHLVPFGEFVPPLFRWFTEMMDIPLGDFNRGALGQASMAWAGQRLAPNICYEDLFGEELAARFTEPAQAPTVLVNVSNIAWFGDSVAIDQHLHISRLRALELARPMVRATNTGATAFIDHRGRVQRQLAPHTRAVLGGVVQGRGVVAEAGGWGITPYAWWAGRWGLWPLVAACAAVVAGVALGRRFGRR